MQQHTAGGQEWFVDTGAPLHLAGNTDLLTKFCSPSWHHSQGIVVGDGSRLPVTAAGSTSLSLFSLNDVLLSPTIIKNLISVRPFTISNSCSV